MLVFRHENGVLLFRVAGGREEQLFGPLSKFGGIQIEDIESAGLDRETFFGGNNRDGGARDSFSP